MEAWALRCNRCSKPAFLMNRKPEMHGAINLSDMNNLHGIPFSRAEHLRCGNCGFSSLIIRSDFVERVTLNASNSSGYREHDNEVDRQTHGFQSVQREEQVGVDRVEAGGLARAFAERIRTTRFVVRRVSIPVSSRTGIGRSTESGEV